MHTISVPKERARAADPRWQVVERVIASGYLNRSARLRDMLLFLADRVLGDEVDELHEHEIGHRVFGRAPDYDTGADTIVRVHASMLRKRLRQYFAAEGAGEPLVIEIPKGNYALTFHKRPETPTPFPSREGSVFPLRWVVGAFLILALTAGVLSWRHFSRTRPHAGAAQPLVQAFWAELFEPGKATDVVLDDASVGTFQQLTNEPLSLSDYFDRDYLRTLSQTAASAKLDPNIASHMALDRETDFWNVNFIWRLLRMPGASEGQLNLFFARDYSFSALKTDNAVLIGDERSNPWMQLFQSHLAAPWAGARRPAALAPPASKPGASTSDADHHQYFALSLVPNLAGNGKVLLVAATGGSAMQAAANFLSREEDLERLAQCLHSGSNTAPLPDFKGLFSIEAHGAGPRKVTIQVCERI